MYSCFLWLFPCSPFISWSFWWKNTNILFEVRTRFLSCHLDKLCILKLLVISWINLFYKGHLLYPRRYRLLFSFTALGSTEHCACRLLRTAPFTGVTWIRIHGFGNKGDTVVSVTDFPARYTTALTTHSVSSYCISCIKLIQDSIWWEPNANSSAQLYLLLRKVLRTTRSYSTHCRMTSVYFTSYECI